MGARDSNLFRLTVRYFDWLTIPGQSLIGGEEFTLDLNDFLPLNSNAMIAVKSGSALPSGLSLLAGVVSGTAEDDATTTTFVAMQDGVAIETNVVFSVVQPPVWSAVPDQLLTQAQAYSLDLNTYVTGIAASYGDPSLTALDDNGITGVDLNMLFEVNKAASDLLGTVAAGSDSDLTADLTINRVRWINSTRRLVLNRTGADAMATYWTDQPNSTTKSVYLLLDTDTLIEIVPAWFDRVFVAAVRWIIPTAEVDTIVALDDIIHGSTILMTVADAGSVDAIASGDSPVISLTAGETLPSGLALTAGVLSGTPDTLQDATDVSFTATQNGASAAQDVSFEVELGVLLSRGALLGTSSLLSASSTYGQLTNTWTLASGVPSGVELNNLVLDFPNPPPTDYIGLWVTLEIGGTERDAIWLPWGNTRLAGAPTLMSGRDTFTLDRDADEHHALIYDSERVDAHYIRDSSGNVRLVLGAISDDAPSDGVIKVYAAKVETS